MSKLVLVAVLATSLVARAAVAQSEEGPVAPEKPPSMAERLFEQGLTDMQAGRFDAGCPALAESYRLEPLPGALFTWAECSAKWGKIATAVERYREYLSQVARMAPDQRERQGEREQVAQQQIETLEPRVPRLTILLADGVPTTASVKRRGVRVMASQLGSPLQIDPGTHEVTLEVPDAAPVTQTVTLAEGEAKTLTLRLPPKAPAKPVVVVPPPDPALDKLRTAAYVVGGVGIAGLVVGTIAGAIAINRNEEIEENCNGLVCNETGISKVETVRESGTVATIGIVVGAAGLAAGLVLYFLSEPENDPIVSHLVADAQGFGFTW